MKPFVLILCIISSVVCALSAPQVRIVGGDDAVLGQIPYQAALSIAGLPICSAVILNELYALTSLHCVCSAGSDRPWPPQLFSIAAGTTDLYTGGVHINVGEIAVNPNYEDLSTGIALLRLSKPFVFNENIKPISLAKTIPPVNSEVEISGWGRIKENENEMHRSLQINEATVIDVVQCSKTLGRKDNEVICLGHPRKNGICRGDFGGPAVYQNQLVGIAAALVGECGSFLPDIFTSIPYYYDWITEQMIN